MGCERLLESAKEIIQKVVAEGDFGGLMKSALQTMNEPAPAELQASTADAEASPAKAAEGRKGGKKQKKQPIKRKSAMP